MTELRRARPGLAEVTPSRVLARRRIRARAGVLLPGAVKSRHGVSCMKRRLRRRRWHDRLMEAAQRGQLGRRRKLARDLFGAGPGDSGTG
jgi:hypothetical protein